MLKAMALPPSEAVATVMNRVRGRGHHGGY
jgi:hypothetical protein